MTAFIADHTGTMAPPADWIRPVHIGAVLVDPAQRGVEPDTSYDGTLSGETAYADLRLMRYIGATFPHDAGPLAVMQYRRVFFLGRPSPLDKRMQHLRLRCALKPYRQRLAPMADRAAYLSHLAAQSPDILRHSLGRADIVANRWNLRKTSLEQQFLSSNALIYPNDPAPLAAWDELKAILTRKMGADVVQRTLAGHSGYLNNCFITSRAEFSRYHDFLFETLDELAAYKNVFRLFGYFAERIQTVYLNHRQSTDADYTIRSKAIVMFD